MIFDPFENRHCRDIRNKTGHSFVRAVQAKDDSLFQSEIRVYQSEDTPAHINEYINHRKTCFKKVLRQMVILDLQPDAHFKVSILLWNLDLFFEVHEWLEIKWAAAHGVDKKALQAMILAAVVYEQLTYGRKSPAKKVATKALLLFKQHRNIIPDFFDLDLLITKLRDLDPVPPKFALLR